MFRGAQSRNPGESNTGSNLSGIVIFEHPELEFVFESRSWLPVWVSEFHWCQLAGTSVSIAQTSGLVRIASI